MRYGKITLASEQGFYLEPSLIKPMGITDGSNCWGIFAEAEANKEKITGSDLIISPFPYSSWACLVRLQTRISLSKSNESVLNILQTLDSQKINVLSLQIVCVGYSHHVMDMVIEIYEQRDFVKIIKDKEKKKKKKKGKVYKYMAREDIERHLVEIYYEICKKMTTLQEEIDNKKNNGISLYDTKKEYFSESSKNYFSKLGKEYFSKLDKNLFGELDEYKMGLYSKAQMKPFEWKWLNSLAFQAFSKNPRLKFLYKEKNNSGFLSLDIDNSKYKNMKEFLCNFNGEKINDNRDDNLLPFLALSSFNTETHYIRIRNLMRNKSLYGFKVPCKVKSVDESGNLITHFGLGTRGLTHSILSKILEVDEKFELVSGSIESLQRSATKASEEKTVMLTGFSTKNFKQEKSDLHREIKIYFDNLIKEKENDKEEAKEKIVQSNNLNLSIKEIQPYKVFLSCRQKLIDSHIEYLKEKLAENGLEVIVSQTQLFDVTRNVIDTLNDCDACLQIYTLSEEEKKNIRNKCNDEFVLLDDGWLLVEFGLAKQRGIPLGRMIDINLLGESQWKQHLRFDTDRLLVSFEGSIDSTSTGKNSFINGLESLALEIIQKIESNKPFVKVI